MKPTIIELYHPHVNEGKSVSMTVLMTPIRLLPTNDGTGRSRIPDIDIVVPIKSKRRRWLHEFKDAVSSEAGIIPFRLMAGEHTGDWSVYTHSIEGYNMRYTLFYSGEPKTEP